MGWWWGGSLLPWDSDIDIQMNANFLYVLERFNNTILENRYLINVNPNFRVHVPQSNNFIDARLVDQQTGYFLDITDMRNTDTNTASSANKLLLIDKHGHKLFYADLYPLVRTEFVGITTWRPFHAEICLAKEYATKALQNTVYKEYNYDNIHASWIVNKSLLKKITLRNMSN